MKFIAVTSCPTGIAHSEMAAESLEEAAKKSNHDIKVEIRGSIGTENELTEKDIKDADAVIIAADISVPTKRFGDKPTVKVGVQKAVKDPKKVIQAAANKAQGKEVDLDEADDGDMKQESLSEVMVQIKDKIIGIFR